MRLGSFALLGLLALASGCGSDPVSETPDAGSGMGGTGVTGGTSMGGSSTAGALVGGTGGADNGGSGATGGTATKPAKCEDGPGYVDLSFPALDVGTVTVTVLTPDDEPAADALVEVCGVNVCTRPMYTDENGDVGISVESPTQKPALKFGDAYTYGELALLFDVDADGNDFGTVYVPRLPADGAPLAPGERAESGGVAVTLPDNGRIELDPFPPYDTDEGRALRAAELPPDLWADGLDHGADLELIFSLAPMGARLCPSAGLELPNPEGWNPGTKVEFYLQGLDAGVDSGAQLFAPYGEWQKLGTGSVDDSGEHLVLESSGLPVVTNVGVRRP